MQSFFAKLGTRKKLFLLVIILIGGISLFGLLLKFELEKLIIHGPIYEEIIEGRDITTDIVPPRLYVVDSYLLSFQQYFETNPQVFDELTRQIEANSKEFQKLYQLWINKLPESKMEDAFIEMGSYAKEFFSLWQTQYLPAIKNRNLEEAQKILTGPMRDLFKKHSLSIQSIVKFLEEKDINIKKEIESIYQGSQIFTSIAWLGTILLCGLVAFLISRSITDRLTNALKEIDSVSKEIDSSMNQQDRSITQQSGSANEITAAMDELNASFKHTHVLSQDSSNRAKNALKLSEEGNNLTKQMLEGLMSHKDKVSDILNQIKRLSEFINQIHNVVSTINNLTNQTNILALNAAVQATRVKQNSGEGFSVIASEIRKLADESKKFVAHIDLLAENIKNATDATVRIAEEGSHTVQESIKLAQASAKAFDEIINITSNSFEGAEQVFLNITQQGQAVHQVLEAMEVLNQTAQQNHAGMKQVKAAVENLNRSSQDLKTIM